MKRAAVYAAWLASLSKLFQLDGWIAVYWSWRVCMCTIFSMNTCRNLCMGDDAIRAAEDTTREKAKTRWHDTNEKSEQRKATNQNEWNIEWTRNIQVDATNISVHIQRMRGWKDGQKKLKPHTHMHVIHDALASNTKKLAVPSFIRSKYRSNFLCVDALEHKKNPGPAVLHWIPR